MRTLVLLALAGTAHGATLVVDPRAPGGFHRISDAVAAASAGDTVEVRAGVYTDEDQPIVLDKPLTIAGVPSRAPVVRPNMPVKNAFPAIFYVTGAGVTIRGLAFEGQHKILIGIYVDGGEGFLIQDNWIRFALIGLVTRQASGVIDGNLIGTDSDASAFLHPFNGLGGHFGAIIGGGTPAEVWITHNTVAENGFSGISCTGDRMTVLPSLGTPAPHVPGTLLVHVLDNTFVRNGDLGLSFVPFQNHSLSDGDAPSSLVGEVSGNRFIHNGYGFVVHAPIGSFLPDACASAALGTVVATLDGNTFAESLRNDALFTFSSLVHTVYGSLACYVHDNSVTVDGAPSFDYDVPDGLNDTLTVDGVVITGKAPE